MAPRSPLPGWWSPPTRWGRRLNLLLMAAFALIAAGCGNTRLLRHDVTTTRTLTVGVGATTPQAADRLGFPEIATRNTTRVAGADPVADAAGVALAAFPSQGAGTHPTAVTIAPTDDWEAALASSVLMASPIQAPILLSGTGSLPTATRDALSALAPTGSGSAGGAQVIRVGEVPKVASSLKSTAIGPTQSNPYALAAEIDTYVTAAEGQPSPDVVIASSADPAYAEPAAGWAAQSGDPILFVSPDDVPQVTRTALKAHDHPHIYVLGPATVVSAADMKVLSRYGTVNRVGAQGAAANSAAFAAYRDPACPSDAACVHIPGSFGWALRSPGHGYTLIDGARPLDAAASAALSATGDYGPQLVVGDGTTLPRAVRDYFLDYATPGYTQEGPTAAVYNHGWIIGDQSAISVAAQAETDTLLQAIPASTK